MEKMYDAIVVGGGPAGLSAAIYMARARFRVLVIEKEKVGGRTYGGPLSCQGTLSRVGGREGAFRRPDHYHI